jgi:CarD family transcriptional regulator
MERKELLDGKKMYFEIEIPVQELSVYLPRRKMEDMGVRPAISRNRLPRVLDKLRSQPRILPNDYKERQAEIWEQLRTGLVMQLAEAVRDLSWHEKREHLTKKDSEYLAQGKSRLAAEMALVSGKEVSDMETRINETLAAAVSRLAERERRHQRLAEVTDLPNRAKRGS